MSIVHLAGVSREVGTLVILDAIEAGRSELASSDFA